MYLGKKQQIFGKKCKYLRFSSARVKIHKILHVNFELTNQFLIKFCIIFFIIMTHKSPVNFTFLAQTLYTSVKSSPLKCKFLRFLRARIKIYQIPHVSFELSFEVNSSSNCASFFIVMTHNFPIYFKLIHFLLWIKGSHQIPNFETFECSGQNLPEYNLEFQGSVRNLQKGAFLCSFIQKYLKITQEYLKITLLLSKRALFC